jgi:hypothetical protein
MMRVFQNQGGGTTIELSAGDDLAKVPESHKDIVTPEIRTVFADPAAHFRKIATLCEIPSLAGWLSKLTETGRWWLVLHEGGFYDRETTAGFYWRSSAVTSAMISLPQPTLSPRMPDGFRHCYSLVDIVHWAEFGFSGGILGSQQHIPLAAFQVHRPKKKGFDPKKCVVWANSSCWDLLVHNDAGRCAFVSHESGRTHELGKVEQALEWVFAQLLDNRRPEFPYS